MDERRHPKTNATVNQLLDRYLDQLEVERTTKSNYVTMVDTHVRPLIGGEKAGRVDGEIIDSLYAELRRCRAHCTSKRRIDHRTPRPHDCDERCRPHACVALAAASIRKVHNILSGAYKKAVRWGWVSTSPLDGAEPPTVGAPNPQPPSPQVAATILNQAWRNDPEWGTQIWIAMVNGCRRGETCAVRWRHLDLEQGTFHLAKAIAQEGRDIWEKDSKGHRDRRIVLDAVTVEILTEHWERRQARAKALGLALSRDAYVFSSAPDGSTPLKPSSVTQRYRRLVERLGISTHLHALRHYTATELIAAGVDVRTVAGRLGHSGGRTNSLPLSCVSRSSTVGWSPVIRCRPARRSSPRTEFPPPPRDARSRC